MLPKKSFKRRMREGRHVIKAQILKKANMRPGHARNRSVQEVRDFVKYHQLLEEYKSMTKRLSRLRANRA